jgi:ATP-binding protein involved in chromosome partitioning
MPPPSPTPQELLERLKEVKYPGFSRDIVSFGLVKDIQVGAGGVTVELATTSAKEDVVDEIRRQVEAIVGTASGLPVRVEVERTQPPGPTPGTPRGRQPIPGVRHVVAVASGKGGVGKSTVAVNLACALVARGLRVGLLDADVYGPSVPTMLGLDTPPEVRPDRRIVPVEKFGLRAISMGLFLGERTPVIWRGPMVTKLVTEFFRNVEWGELDYLILDLPPGTGDAQLTVAQQVALAGGVIVTTPQDVALLDVKRGITMFQQVDAPVLGVVENMSYHVCSGCGHRAEIFGHGGGEAMARALGVPFLGEIALVPAIRRQSDAGVPIVVAEPTGALARPFHDLAGAVDAQVTERAAGVHTH